MIELGAVSHHQAMTDRAGGCDRHLLMEDGTNGSVPAVDLSGQTKSWPSGDERPEDGIGAEGGVDHGRIAVEIEETSDALDGHLEIGDGVEAETGPHGIRSRSDLDHTGATGEAHRTSVDQAIGVAVNRLDSGRCVQRQPREQVTDVRLARSWVGVEAKTSRTVSLN